MRSRCLPHCSRRTGVRRSPFRGVRTLTPRSSPASCGPRGLSRFSASPLLTACWRTPFASSRFSARRLEPRTARAESRAFRPLRSSSLARLWLRGASPPLTVCASTPFAIRGPRSSDLAIRATQPARAEVVWTGGSKRRLCGLFRSNFRRSPRQRACSVLDGSGERIAVALEVSVLSNARSLAGSFSRPVRTRRNRRPCDGQVRNDFPRCDRTTLL